MAEYLYYGTLNKILKAELIFKDATGIILDITKELIALSTYNSISNGSKDIFLGDCE